MESILDKNQIEKFIKLSEEVQKNSKANWGKMNAGQMFQHLNKSLEVIFTNKPIKRMFIGRIIGKTILKKALKSKQSIDKNSPTAPSFVSDKSVDFQNEKERWIGYLNNF